jgi:hypothetical protein
MEALEHARNITRNLFEFAGLRPGARMQGYSELASRSRDEFGIAHDSGVLERSLAKHGDLGNARPLIEQRAIGLVLRSRLSRPV